MLPYEDVLGYLIQHGPRTKWEIMEAHDLTFSAADRLLRHLREQGRVKLIHNENYHGHYKWKARITVRA